MTFNITELRFGRNVGTDPMPRDTWEQFQTDAVAALEEFAETVAAESWTEVHTGTGTWTDSSGVTVVEESAVATLYWRPAPETLEKRRFALDVLKKDAAEMAGRYDQAAVAVVSEGRSTLISPQGVES